jgi:hypothetical protein
MGNWLRTALLRSELFILTNHSVLQTRPKLFLGNNVKVGPRRMQKPRPQKTVSLAACFFLLGQLGFPRLSVVTNHVYNATKRFLFTDT